MTLTLTRVRILQTVWDTAHERYLYPSDEVVEVDWTPLTLTILEGTKAIEIVRQPSQKPSKGPVQSDPDVTSSGEPKE